MKHHQTKGAIIIETREQLGRELDKLLNKDIHNIQERDRWLLDLQQSDVGDMSLRQIQYSIFTLRAANTLGGVVMQRTGGKTKDFATHVKMEGIEVPTVNTFDSDGSLKEEKAADAMAPKNKEVNPKDHAAITKTERQTTVARTPTGKPTPTTAKLHRENAKQEKKKQRQLKAKTRGTSTTALWNYDRSRSSSGALRADYLSMLGYVTIPKVDSRTVTALLQPIRSRTRGMTAAAAEEAASAEANTPVASRSLPTREIVKRGSIATLAQGQ